MSIILKEETFAAMLAYLNQNFQVVSADRLWSAPRINPKDQRPTCMITFDDGWRDNYTTAYPWLKKFGLPATIFLVTGLVGERRAFWIERLAAVWRNPSGRKAATSTLVPLMNQDGAPISFDAVVEFLKHMTASQREEILGPLLDGDSTFLSDDDTDRMLTWNEIREMSRNGICFGTHTVTHPLLPYEDDNTVAKELLNSKMTLEENLAGPVRAFAYPNGDWNERVKGFVRKAGYDCAFTTREGWYVEGSDLYTIRRVLVHEGNVTGWNGKFSPAVFSLTLARGA